MAKFKRLCLSYIFASFASITVGLVVAKLYAHWTRTQVTTWVFLAIIWLVIVGVPSLFAAVNDLTRQLGVKSSPILRTASNRLIPINYDKGISTFAYVLGGRPTARQGRNTSPVTHNLNLPEIEIQYDDYILREPELNQILRTAWSRQRNGEAPLSRTWWLSDGQLDRGEYNAIIGVLMTYGLITGRKQGRSGKLYYPPSKTLSILRSELI